MAWGYQGTSDKNSKALRILTLSKYKSHTESLYFLKYRVIPYRRALRECEGFGARLLVLKRGPNHDLPLMVKSSSKSDC